jgi:hypothetical protein
VLLEANVSARSRRTPGGARDGGGEVAERDRIPLEDVEALIRSVDGVQRAKVTVNDWGAIEAIHVLGDQRRPAKRVIRDIESALAAQLGIMVDHRKISLAQVAALSAEGTLAPRIVYAGHRVEVDRPTGRSWLHVRLVRQDSPDTVYEGSAEGRGAGTKLRLAAVEATLQAVAQAVTEDLWLDAPRLDPIERDEGRVWVVTVVARLGQGQEQLCAGTAVERAGDEVGAIAEGTVAALAGLLERASLRAAPDPGLEEDGVAGHYVEVEP